MLVNKWYTTSNKVVESKIPPLEEISLPVDDRIVTASPFKIDIVDTKGDPTNKDINRILQQDNYTNQLLYVVSNQILEADNKSVFKDKPSPSYNDKNKKLETHPIFKLPEFSNQKFPRFKEKVEITDDLIETINKKLKSELNFTNVNTLSENNNDVNKLSSSYSTKNNYYKKPSFPDMQYEENEFLSHTSHSGREITEWRSGVRIV